MELQDVTGNDWCGLAWSPWVPFNGGLFGSITNGPGVYRVRVAGQRTLAYIGQSGRSVRARLQSLRTNAASGLMPYDDPHTAAPSLWAWNDARGFTYECSGAPASQDKRERLALECWLLWHHRVALGHSTLCNHGHFHPSYIKSGNRKSGRRGGLREEILDLQFYSVSSQKPLLRLANPTDSNWMGLRWSDWTPPQELCEVSEPGLYRIRFLSESELLYIGETRSLAKRMQTHAKTFASLGPVEASCAVQPTGISRCGLHELENDLIGGYYDPSRTMPALQFSNVQATTAKAA